MEPGTGTRDTDASDKSPRFSPTKLPPLAKSIGLQAEYKFVPPGVLLESLKSGGHNRVFICHVNWNGGGGHFVVIPRAEANEVVVLDPYYGLQTTNHWPRYTGGYFTGNVVEVRR